MNGNHDVSGPDNCEYNEDNGMYMDEVGYNIIFHRGVDLPHSS